MMDVVPVDPDLPRQRKTIAGGVMYSALATLLVLFSLGRVPRIDAFFSATDAVLRSHNDVFVNALMTLAPLAFVGAGVFVAVYTVLGYMNRQRRQA